MEDIISRRRFIQAIAASVVAVGVPLPIGLGKAEMVQLTYKLQPYQRQLAYWAFVYPRMAQRIRAEVSVNSLA